MYIFIHLFIHSTNSYWVSACPKPFLDSENIAVDWHGSWPAGSWVVAAIDKYTGTTESCGGKGTAWPLSKWERARARESPPLAWTGFYCFSEHITRRMVLIYYAQVQHRWLPFKDNKGQNTANYFKEKDVTTQGESCSQSILGWFSTDFRKLKILSKHLLPQGEGVLARASLIAV